MRAMTTEQSKARSAARHGDGAALDAAPSRAQRARARRRAQLTAWGFIAPVLVYLGLFYAYPLYRNIDLSLRSYTLASFITGDAPFAGFANYAKVIESSTFAPALINTAIFVFASIAFQFAIGLALAVSSSGGSVSPASCGRCSSCRGSCRCWSPRQPGRGCSTATRGS